MSLSWPSGLSRVHRGRSDCLRSRLQFDLFAVTETKNLPWPSNPCFNKNKGNPQKNKGFLFTQTPKSLEKDQRRRDDNKSKIFGFWGGRALGAERKIVQNAVFFRGKRHDNKILKVHILLSRHFVVIAQAPKGKKTIEKSKAHRKTKKARKSKKKKKKKARIGGSGYEGFFIALNTISNFWGYVLRLFIPFFSKSLHA